MRILTALIAVLSLSACVSTYQKNAVSAHNAYYRGDYDRALKLIDKVKPAERDKLLYLLDKGMILHAVGKYKESNVALTEAEELSSALAAKSVTREVAATLWSEEATEYAGERHERAMIIVMRMLNYIMLDDWEGAQVEVRRLGYVVEKAYGAEHEFDNAFAVYLSAIAWEVLGNINDALIDYKSLAKKDKAVPYYGYDLKTASSKLGLPVKLPPKESMAWQKSKGYRNDRGQLIIIAQVGRAPGFVSDYMSTGYFTVSVPRAVMYEPLVSHAQVFIDGKDVGRTHSFYNIADDILIALKERQKRSLIRKVVKMSVQTGLYAAGLELMEEDEIESQIAGIALSFLAMSMSASDKADERSWRTLPASFQIGRFYLKPGKYKLEIKPDGAFAAIERRVEISEHRPKVLLVDFPQTALFAQNLDAPKPAYVAHAQNKEKALSQKVGAHPKDGRLKIELAEARMQRGDYDVEGLLITGMSLGADRQDAVQDLVIAYTVKGQYADALKWANQGARFIYYADALKYLMDKGPLPPSSDAVVLTEKQGLIYAFNYFMQGLLDEKSGDYEDATKSFAKAHELGLVGEAVVKKVISSYKMTDDSFKKSEKGVGIISGFAESFF
ncbi:MAG: hypothetical protein ABH871_02565 [Pseudomonadota bacterium]